MQGIIRYVHHYTGKTISYGISRDIEKNRDAFELRKQDTENHRTRYLKNIDFSIAEITDELGIRLAYYVLPQSERIVYDDSLYAFIEEPKAVKKLRNALDWVIMHFPENAYEYVVSVNQAEEKNPVKILITKDSEKFEEYVFYGCKEPNIRTIY